VIENDLVKQTSAYRNEHIVYLTPDVWYLAEGGITATDIMLKDLETGMLDY
jgi:iron complex transport system substrate-binding protein